MKIAAISTLLPQTHYSQYLCRALEAGHPGALTVYADHDPRNADVVGCGRVVPLWPKTPAYVTAVLRALAADRPDIVHIQHEFNMYGGAVTAAVFPLLLWRLRRMGLRTVVTVHAVVDPGVVDRRFLGMFSQGLRRCPPVMARLFFAMVYRGIGRFAGRIVVHTRMMRDLLVNRYRIPGGQIDVIPMGVPALKIPGQPGSDRYALYFGYLARRKGLEKVLGGFQRFLSTHPDSSLNLVLAGGTIPGQEYARREIEQWIADRHLSARIRLTGFVAAGEAMDTLFGQALCVVIPAEVSIAASGPMSQALRYGKCILASRLGNLCEEIEDGVDGRLVDNDAWDRAFAFVDDPRHQDAVAGMQKNAILKAQARSWPTIAQRHLDLYRNIMK